VSSFEECNRELQNAKLELRVNMFNSFMLFTIQEITFCFRFTPGHSFLTLKRLISGHHRVESPLFN